MTFLCEEVTEFAKGVIIAKEPRDLISIRDPHCAATLWKRKLQPDFRSWIDSLPIQNLPEGRLILPKEKVSDAVRQLCEISGIEDSSNRELFINDIDSLAQLFAAVMEAGYLRLRLEKVIDNACQKFHKDAVTARLVCTYRGHGTEYGTSIEGEEPARIYTTPTGAPILLRGSVWPEHPNSHLLHRSPPIEGTGKTRLVLVLDPVFDPKKED